MMRLCIGRIPVDILDNNEQAKKRIIELVNRTNTPSFVVTLNPEIAYRAEIDRRIRYIVRHSSLNIIDGIGIAKIIKWKTGITPTRITGVDTIWQVLMNVDDDIPVFLYGAKPDVLNTVVEKLVSSNPNINIVGISHGYRPWDRVAEEIIKARPRLLLVALGAGRQETFMYHYIRPLTIPILSIGVGGSFDVWSGKVERAPKQVQDLGLEWLWRNIKQPSRIGRLMYSMMYMITALKKEVRECEK